MNTSPAHQEPQGPTRKPSRRQRLKISNACQACRLRKIKCDGGRPACVKCQGRGKTCTYSRNPTTTGQQTKRHTLARHASPNHSHISVPASPPASTKTPSAGPSPNSEEHLHEDQDPASDHYNAHGRFAGEVAAAIDVRVGLAPATTSNAVPFVDAPLFGEIDLDSPCTVPAELPPRAHADRLVSIYWKHVHHVESILNRGQFFRDYEASYSNPDTLVHMDRDIWFSILNVVFALAVQRQESIPRQKRDEEGNRYFQRAWVLLRPEAILWKPGSLELVQCLMLLNRYIHCTDNQQKTWMTAGLAMRIAQNSCCYLPGASSTKDSRNGKQLKQQIWTSCIGLDRCVSWSLGTPAPSLSLLPNRIDSVTSSGSYEQSGAHSEYFRWGLELYEIGSQIQLAQTQTRNSLAARLGLPRLFQPDEYHAVAVQLEACLNKWEYALPSDWKLQNFQNIVDRRSRVERYLLHIRILHIRIFLYRPMLARYYSKISQTSNSPDLSDRLLKECAGMCVEAAQKMASLIIETLEPNEPLGILPWWYRIYYLHIAGTNFLAAMFRSDLFTESVSQSWQKVISALRAHEHLSLYVRQCIQTFETLSTKILGTRNAGSDDSPDAILEEGSSGHLFDDIFQDLGFDFDDFVFGTEDIFGGPSWPAN